MRELYVIAHDMRSTFNVGSLFRTAEGLGVRKVFLTGYTPYPSFDGDQRLPHLQEKISTQIDKTALGAVENIEWAYKENITSVITWLKNEGVLVAALEQSNKSIPLTEFEAPNRLALLLGTEVTGLPKNIMDQAQIHLMIPMKGKKESFNVVQAAAMALYEFQFH